MEKKNMYKNIDPHVQLMELNAIQNLPPFLRDSVVWPTEDTIQLKQMDQKNHAVEEAIRSTIRWHRTILQEQWVPEDVEERLLLLRADIEGHDTIRVRYEKDDFQIQAAYTSGNMCILIRDNRGPAKKTMEEKTLFLLEALRKVFAHSNEIIETTCGNITEMPDKNVDGKPMIPNESMNYWWGLCSLWTDGKVVRVTTGKADGGSAEPVLMKDWFSEKELEQ